MHAYLVIPAQAGIQDARKRNDFSATAKTGSAHHWQRPAGSVVWVPGRRGHSRQEDSGSPCRSSEQTGSIHISVGIASVTRRTGTRTAGPAPPEEPASAFKTAASARNDAASPYGFTGTALFDNPHTYAVSTWICASVSLPCWAGMTLVLPLLTMAMMACWPKPCSQVSSVRFGAPMAWLPLPS